MLSPNTRVHMNGSLTSTLIYGKYRKPGLYNTDCQIKKSNAETLQSRNLLALVHSLKAKCGKGIKIYLFTILTKQASRRYSSG